MLRIRSTQLSAFLSLVLLLAAGHAFAQPGSIDSAVASFAAGRGHTDKHDSPSGSISGRVFNDAAQSEDTETSISEGIAGVRVILRSKENGTDVIVANRISDVAGRFGFDALWPGKYTIEVDSVSMPAKYRTQVATLTAIDVEALQRSNVELPVTARRQIVGMVFLDNDGNGRYTPGKDVPVEGALISVDGQLSVSNSDGTYILRDLPAGRISMLVSWPKKNENTHVVFYLPPGPVTNRIVNISKER